MRKGHFLLLFLALMWGCKNDFAVNDNWKEIRIIYGLLNVNDSIHYIRIEKAFQNGENISAYDAAKNIDSLSDDTLIVELTDLNTTEKKTLEKVYSTRKDTGTFASPGVYLYQIRWALNVKHKYFLSVLNPKTGVRSTATTTIVAPIEPVYPQASSFNINFQPKASLPFKFNTGANGKFYNMDMVVHYREYAGRDTLGTMEEKQIIWPIFKYRQAPSMIGGLLMTEYVQGNDFFSLLRHNISVDKNKTRKIRNIDIRISGGGEQIYNYIQVNQPSIGLVQKKPEYTNIQESGYGIFSSRSFWQLSLPVGPAAKKFIATDPSFEDLNFVQ
jgi:hypothetical protein